MNSVETLTKAIKLVEAHGWTGLVKGWDVNIWPPQKSMKSEPYILEPVRVGAADFRVIPWQVIIYNHAFAEALWSKVRVIGTLGGDPAWEYHLQQLVIAPDPFEYLGANI